MRILHGLYGVCSLCLVHSFVAADLQHEVEVDDESQLMEVQLLQVSRKVDKKSLTSTTSTATTISPTSTTSNHHNHHNQPNQHNLEMATAEPERDPVALELDWEPGLAMAEFSSEYERDPVALLATSENSSQHCARPGSIPGGSCQNCKETAQCSSGYCCPFMKKCVNSGQRCYLPIASCRPTCHTASCSTCSPTDGSDYNRDWGLPTCGSSAPSHSSSSHSSSSRSSDTPQEWLMLINAKRARHGACPLTWSTALANGIKEWVDGLTRLHHSHSYDIPPPGGPAGENLAFRSPAISVQHSVDMWYDEVNDCGPLPGCKTGSTGTTGHFTAMVWKGARELGCAISSNGRFSGCRFKAGNRKNNDTPNMRGAYEQNVGALGERLRGC